MTYFTDLQILRTHFVVDFFFTKDSNETKLLCIFDGKDMTKISLKLLYYFVGMVLVGVQTLGSMTTLIGRNHMNVFRKFDVL